MNKGRLIPQIRRCFSNLYHSSQRLGGTCVPLFCKNHSDMSTREISLCNSHSMILGSSLVVNNRFYSTNFGSYLKDLDIFSQAKAHFKTTMANIVATTGFVVDPLAQVETSEELEEFVQMIRNCRSDLETIPDPDILWMLSELYSHGLGGLEKDGDKAVKLLEKSIAMGSVPAMLLYGIRLLYGVEDAIAINEKEGFKFVKMAADHGDDSGQNILGSMLCFGTSFHNPLEGVKYLKMATNQNNPLAMDNLGRVYERGLSGIEKNEHLAFKWYKKGAQFGHPNSQFKLGEMYKQGKHDDDVKDPLKEAVKWLSMSAANLNPEALNKLGVMYRDGIGLEQNFELAKQFLNLSIQYGSFNAVSDLIKLQGMEMKKVSFQENASIENVDTIPPGLNRNADEQNLRQFPNEKRSSKEAKDSQKATWKHDFTSKPSHKKR